MTRYWTHHVILVPLQWRHNESDGVSDHQPHDCLLNHLFRHRSKKTSKFCVTGLCAGNSYVTGEFPAQRAINTLRPRQNGCRFADDTFKRIFLNENVRTSMKISLKFVPKGPINNNPALVQIMAWRRSSDKPLSEPMMVSLLTHICVTRPQWVYAENVSIWWRHHAHSKKTSHTSPLRVLLQYVQYSAVPL